MVGITATGYRILQDIGLNGSSTGYAISKRRNRVTEKTAYTLLPRLVKEGLLSVEVIGRTRSGLKKKEYSLTLAGVCHLLLSHSRKKPSLYHKTLGLFSSSCTWNMGSPSEYNRREHSRYGTR